MTTDVLLAIGRYAFLGLLYLFVLLVLRALLAEMRAETQVPGPRPAARAAQPSPTIQQAPPVDPGDVPDRRIPSQPLPPRLILVESSDPSRLPIGTAFPLTAVTTVGRGLHNSVALTTDRHASNNHALLFVRDGVIHLRDRGSTNGTYVNGVRLEDEMSLNDGDRVTIGTTVLRFSAQEVTVVLSVADSEPD